MKEYLLLSLLLREKDGVDVRENTSGRDGDVSEELVELFVVADRELDVTRDDAGSLVVTRGVSGELEDLGSEVLEDRGHVDRGSASESVGEVHSSHVSRDTSDGELKSRLRRSARALSLALSASSFSFSGHCKLMS